MLIRAFTASDLARITALTIETFRPFFKDSSGPSWRRHLRQPAR
jgi:hypothetical protein